MTVSVHLTSSSATSVHRPSPSHHRPIRRVSTPPRIAKPLFAAGQALNEQRLLQREQHQPTFRIVTTNEAGRHDAARGSASYRVLPAPRAPLRGGLGLFDEEDTFYVEPIIREVDSEFDDESASDGNANTRGELDSTGKKVAGTSAAVALITSETIAADWKQLVALHSLPTLPEHRATASSSSSLSSMTAALDDRSPSMSSSPGSTTASAAEDSGSDDVDSLGGGGGLQTPPAVPEKQLLQLQIQQQQRLVRRSGSKNGTSRGDAASLSGSSSGRSNASRRLSGREPGENCESSPAVENGYMGLGHALTCLIPGDLYLRAYSTGYHSSHRLGRPRPIRLLGLFAQHSHPVPPSVLAQQPRQHRQRRSRGCECHERLE